MGNVTLQTIADRVGVSRTTVSNAFSRPDQLSTELRERIRAVADELGYAGPDPVARSLRSGQVGAIGVLLTETLGYTFHDPYTASFLTGISEAGDGTDITDTRGMLLLPLPPQRPTSGLIRNAVVDGFVVFILPDDHEALDVVRARGLPTVTVDGPELEGVPFIAGQDRSAAAEMTRRVLAAGHTSVLVLTFRLRPDGRVGPVDQERLAAATYRVSRERVGGVLEAAAASAVGVDAVRIHEVAERELDECRAAVRTALTGDDPPTAIVAMSDRFALAAMDVAAELGLDVPGDLSVTGFDDIAAAAHRGLTTVRQAAAGKGRLATQIITGAVDPAGSPFILPSEVVERATLGPPPT